MEFLARLGTRVEAALERAGLPPALEYDAHLRVSTLAEGRFLEDARQREGVDELAWCAASDPLEQISASLLDRLAAARTLLDALRAICAGAAGESSRLSVWLVERRDGATLCHRGSTRIGEPGSDELTLMRTRMLVEILRGFSGEDWSPPACTLALSRLPGPRARADLALSADALHPAISCFHIPRRMLVGAPRPGFFTRVQRGGVVDELVPPAESSSALEVLLRPYVSRGLPSIAEAAALAGVSARTLQRMLRRCDTTYQALLDKVRLDVATEALADPRLRIIDVAHSAGFRDQAHFTHFFKRKCGTTPQSYRQSHGRRSASQANAPGDGAISQGRPLTRP